MAGGLWEGAVHSAASFERAFQAFMNASASVHINQPLFSLTFKKPNPVKREKGKDSGNRSRKEATHHPPHKNSA